jgi:hypothetical protein
VTERICFFTIRLHIKQLLFNDVFICNSTLSYKCGKLKNTAEAILLAQAVCEGYKEAEAVIFKSARMSYDVL